MVELTAGVSSEQLLEVGVDGLPGGHLLSGVLNPRNGRTTNKSKKKLNGHVRKEIVYLCTIFKCMHSIFGLPV